MGGCMYGSGFRNKEILKERVNIFEEAESREVRREWKGRRRMYSTPANV
jgi:hypothetical protein